MRGLRPNSKLGRLSQEQRDQLVVWLLVERSSYPVARKRVLATFDVSTTSNALRRFYAQFCVPTRAHHLKTGKVGKVRLPDPIFEEQLRQEKARGKRGQAQGSHDDPAAEPRQAYKE